MNSRAAPPQLMTLEIEKVVAGGLGLARSEAGVVLLPGVLGGERVEARVRAARGVREGEVTQLLRASPDRREAPILPTADLAHARYPAQLGIKRDLVKDALRRIGRLHAEVEETVPSPREWAYRNGAQYLITPQGFAYRQRREHQPWLLERRGAKPHDPLAMEAVTRVLAQLDPLQLAPARELALRGSRYSGEVVATLVAEGEPRQYLRAAGALLDAGAVGVSLAAPAGRRFSAGVRLIAGESDVTEQLGDALLSVSASGFAQVNPEAAGQLYRAAAQLAGGGRAAVDLYGGSGAIARHLAPHFAAVTVIDSASEALKRGQKDISRRPELSHLRFVRAEASQLPECDVLVIDPPRAGLEERARQAVAASSAERLVYVSCNPATWARDVGALTREGWQLRRVIPHDFISADQPRGSA